MIKDLKTLYEINKNFYGCLDKTKAIMESFDSKEKALIWLKEMKDRGYKIYSDPFYKESKSFGYIATKLNLLTENVQEQVFNIDDVKNKLDINAVSNPVYKDAVDSNMKASEQRRKHLEVKSLKDIKVENKGEMK